MDRPRRSPAGRGGRQTPSPRVDDSRLRLIGLVVLCAKVALVPLVFDHAADASFVVPKALLSHGLAYVLAGVVLALVVLNGPRALVRSRVHIPVAAYLGVSLIATAFAVNPTIALFGTHDRMLGLGSIADGVITLVAAVELVRTRRDVIAVVVSMLTASLVVVGYEVLQLSGRDPLSWSSDSSQRPFATVGQPTTLGQYLVTLSVIAYAFGLLAPDLRRAVRGALIAYSAVLLFAAGFTATRSVAIAFAAAAVAFIVGVWLKRPGADARSLSVWGGLGAAGILGVVLITTPIGGRLQSTVDTPTVGSTNPSLANAISAPELEQSASQRFVIYGMALAMVIERPILGYGPDNFASGVPVYRPQLAPPELRQTITTSSHSFVAAVATNSGILGLIAFSAVLLVAAFELFRARYTVIAAAGAIALIAYMGAGVTTVGAIETETQFWLAIAAVAGACARNAPSIEVAASSRSGDRVRSASMSQRVGIVSILLASVLVMATGLTALGASRLAQKSVTFRTLSTMNVAIDLASQATQSDPNRAEYWEQLALAYAGAGRWTDASNAFERAAALEPYDIRFVSDDIQVQLLLSNQGDAQALSRAAALGARMTQIDPNNPRAHIAVAQVARARQDFDGAARSIEHALELDPNSTNPSLYLAAMDIYVAGSRVEDAIRVGKVGVANLARSLSVRVALARSLQLGGHSSDALTQIEAALTINPNDPAVLQLRDQIRATQ